MNNSSHLSQREREERDALVMVNSLARSRKKKSPLFQGIIAVINHHAAYYLRKPVGFSIGKP